ncbi:hypothetical protein R6Q59_000438 [Mikania micrantha]
MITLLLGIWSVKPCQFSYSPLAEHHQVLAEWQASQHHQPLAFIVLSLTSRVVAFDNPIVPHVASILQSSLLFNYLCFGLLVVRANSHAAAIGLDNDLTGEPDCSLSGVCCT